jgi:iron complex outermembrane recepter protein
MEMLPNWSLTFDPAIAETENRSLGLVARARYRLGVGDGEVVAGVDLDRSPGSRFERRVAPLREDGIFTGFTPGDPLYDYDVTFTEVAPYLHGEMDLLPGVRVQAGSGRTSWDTTTPPGSRPSPRARTGARRTRHPPTAP